MAVVNEEEQRQVQNHSQNVLSLGERASSQAGYKVPEGLGQVSRALQALGATTVDAKLVERLARAEQRRNAATKLQQ